MAHLVTDESQFDAQSRVVAIRLATLTLRLQARWREVFGSEDAATIMLAIAAIRSERILREPADADHKTLAVHLPKEALGKCNISSIATATGYNRETARRRVQDLIDAGMLVREAGEIRFVPGFTQQESFAEAIRNLLDDVRRTANDLLRDGAIRMEKR